MREDVIDDASTVFLEARHPSGETRAIGVLIDNNISALSVDVPQHHAILQPASV
jgi:hypothetical protein